MRIGHSAYPRQSVLPIAAMALALLAGCAEPGPKRLVMEPWRQASAATSTTAVGDGPSQSSERFADTNGDGRADYWQRPGPDGRIASLSFDTTRDGKADQVVDRTSASPNDRHLIILLDSIPFELMKDAYQAGRFRLFHPPRRMISPYPVMTDLSFSELFDVSPSPGVEASYYDGRKLRDGYDVYAHGGNAGWNSCVDYALMPLVHAVAYLDPRVWYDHEMGKIQRVFLGSEGDFRGYVVSTSALGAWYGREGHVPAIEKLDAVCEYIMHQSGGRVQITLLSDHGHVLLKSRRIPLSDLLVERGWSATKRLSGDKDVVVPEFGVVGCAAIHTRMPAAVAKDCVEFEGVDLAMYRERDSGRIVALSRDGQAVISMNARGRFAVRFERGDPLKISNEWESLRQSHRLDDEGFATDEDLWTATRDSPYPDVVYRIWRAFNGLVENVPDVYLSIADGYLCGSKLMTKLVDVSAVHGGLGAISSEGFVMTTAGELPEVMRMRDLAKQLEALGVPLRRKSAVAMDRDRN